MKRRSFFAILAVPLMGTLSRAFAQAAKPPLEPLRMAVHPYNSTLSLIRTFRPLMEFLSQALGREIEFFTAPTFDAYLTALLAGEYDFAIAPPHFAVLAMQKGYVPLVHYRSRLEPVLAVRKDGPIHEVTDLRGKRIAMADPASFIRIAVVKLLNDKGLRAGHDFTIVEKQTHGAAVAAVAIGEVDAGLATTNLMNQIPADMAKSLRSVSFGVRFPHIAFLGHSRLGEQLLASTKKALFEFQDSPAGQEFFKSLGLVGFEELSREDLQIMKPYADFYLRMQAKP
jgi:phosphonate transport system substrate-binding protein